MLIIQTSVTVQGTGGREQSPQICWEGVAKTVDNTEPYATCPFVFTVQIQVTELHLQTRL